ITTGDLTITAIHTPGHAEHHIAWGIGSDIVFAGDIGGIRMPGCDYVRLPLVPPELHLEKWRASLEKIRALNFARIAPTHFSIFDNAESHIQSELKIIEDTSAWLEAIMPSEPSTDELGAAFAQWMMEEGRAAGVSEETLQTYEIANPLHMAATGLSRYWKKYRQTVM
ncbi:MAG: MBL fold metallo-hydrolase, partial [Anaerolineales bacterium]|nr:MBL fold metallo-hydrolase [Anaerolineales bacterium]